MAHNEWEFVSSEVLEDGFRLFEFVESKGWKYSINNRFKRTRCKINYTNKHIEFWNGSLESESLIVWLKEALQ